MSRLMLAALTASLLLGSGQVPDAQSPHQDEFRFHFLRKLYVQPIENLQTDRRIDDALRRELTTVGFIVVDARQEADAVVALTWQVEVVIHGGPEDYPKDIFTVVLEAPGGATLWRGRVSVVESRSERRATVYKARAIANALVKAWNKSARRSNYKLRLKQGEQQR